MDLWSGVVRVPLFVRNRKNIGSEDNNCFKNNNQKKRSQSREWNVYHFNRRVLKSVFQIYGKYFYGIKRRLDFGPKVVRVPPLSKQEESFRCYPDVVKQSL